jgi:hypothetical protein
MKQYRKELIGGHELLVHYKVYPARPATMEQPPEDEEIEIVEAFYFKSNGGLIQDKWEDALPLFEEWPEIHEKILEEINEH